MSCAPNAPVFWQPQPRLPLPVMKVLGARVEAALRAPADRALLVWPLVLGAPALRAAHPDGIPEPVLLAGAAGMLGPLGVTDPGAAWAEQRLRLPDTAVAGPGGWAPHPDWEDLASLVSLRLGVALLAMLGQPEDGRYGLACGVALFNCALYHECHDALEPLWQGADGALKTGLQGLIMLAGGFHHLQLHNPGGMTGLWGDALAALAPFRDSLATPWGTVALAGATGPTAERLAWLDPQHGNPVLDPLWAMARPVLELT